MQRPTNTPASSRYVLMVAALLACACTSSTRYAIVTVEDPERLAAAATSVHFGARLETLESQSLAGNGFPVTFGFESDHDDQRAVWVEARAAGGAVLGRGKGTVTLRKGSPTTTFVSLAAPCATDLDCEGALSCRGRAACQDFMCVYLDKTELCTREDGSNGWCEGLSCVPSVCGDSRVDPRSEGCDDQNQNPADGCDTCTLTTWVATSVIEGTVLAAEVSLAMPSGVALDRRGDLYFAENANHRVRKLSIATGVVKTVAGTGTKGYSGDGGVATAAQLSSPAGIAVDGLGNVFVADSGNHRVRKITASTGRISTVAGNGTASYSGDGGGAVSAQLLEPQDVAVDGLGNLYIADWGNYRVRKVAAGTGVITTAAGTGCTAISAACPLGDGGLATNAQLSGVQGVEVDVGGALYIADTDNHRVRKVDPSTGIITTVAGSGCASPQSLSTCPLGEGGLATSATLFRPRTVTVDDRGNLFIADTSHFRVRKVDATSRAITTVAGNGAYAFSGDGGTAAGAALTHPYDVAVGEQGHLFIADHDNHRIRRVAFGSAIITTVAGNGTSGSAREGAAATSTELEDPTDVAVDVQGTVYVVDSGHHRVWGIAPGSGIVTTVAGTGGAGHSGDGGLAREAQLNDPQAIAVDAASNLYVVEGLGARVRRISAATGVITTYAGTGIDGYSGDGGPATSAQLRRPTGVAVAATGDVYVACPWDQRVRRIAAGTGIITTVVGTGVRGFAGDDGPAASALVAEPQAVAVDGQGNLFVADTSNRRVRRVAAGTGFITTVVGTGAFGDSGDGGPAIAAALKSPFGLELDQAGNLYVADNISAAVRRIDAISGVITTVVGLGLGALSTGDGAPALSATLGLPCGVAIDGQGNLYVADAKDGRVRKVAAATGTITTAMGLVDPAGMGSLVQAQLANPLALTWAASLEAWLFAGGSSGTLQALRPTRERLDAVAGRYLQPESAVATLSARYRDDTFGSVGGLAYDEARGLIYLTESSANRLWVVTAVDPSDESTWTLSPLAGDSVTARAGFADGAASAALFRNPTGLFLDASSQLYIADTGNHVVRRLNLFTGEVSTVAGIPEVLGFHGDEGLASEALLDEPRALTRCPNGDLFVADTGNNRVRRVDESNTITTVLGDGTAASSGQGFPARTFPVHAPQGLACDDFGNLFVTSTQTLRMLPASDEHVVDGEGEVQSLFGVSRPPTPLEELSSCLAGIAIVDATTLRVTDACEGLLIELSRNIR